MSRSIILWSFVLSAFIFVFANCDPTTVDYRLCDGTPAERSQNSTIYNVTMDPCSTRTNDACDISAGANATVTVDFSPSESIPAATRHGLYWDTTVQMELKGLPKKACKGFVSCREGANQRRTYSAVIPLKASFPKRAYDVKVKLYLGNRKVFFCVVIPVNLK